MGLKSSQAEVLRVSEVKEIWSLSAGAIFRVPQVEGNWGYSRYLRVAALGDSVFLWVKGLVVPEADETQASFRLGVRFLKIDGIWGLPPWNLKPSG